MTPVAAAAPLVAIKTVTTLVFSNDEYCDGDNDTRRLTSNVTTTCTAKRWRLHLQQSNGNEKRH